MLGIVTSTHKSDLGFSAPKPEHAENACNLRHHSQARNEEWIDCSCKL